MQALRVIAMGLCFSVVMAVSGVAGARELPDFTELVINHGDAVVNISTTQKVSQRKRFPGGGEMPEIPEGTPFGEWFKHFFDEENGGESTERFRSQSLGSGFIISKDGYVMTNNHVVKGADEIIVKLTDRREIKAELIGTDPRSDIALLKLISEEPLPVVKIGKSEKLKVGEWVLAIGSPFGFEQSVTAGIVSAKGRSLPRENYVPFIQTDVAINPGNSGGPLFNLDGQVVGINSQIYSRTGGFMGLSFAIPIDVAMEVAEQLKDSGEVKRGWLGILIQDVTRDLAESFGMDKPEGALVAKVLPDSPAEAAGFQSGDVVIEFNGRDIATSSSLPPVVGRTKVGKAVPVKIYRGGKKKTLSVTIGELPSDDELKVSRAQPKPVEHDKLGLVVQDVSDEDRKQLELKEPGGVLVKDVNSGPAAEAGVKSGDVIVSLNNENIKDAKSFGEIVESLPDGKSVAMLIMRSNGPIWLALKTN
jgi:serine protease Do